VYGTPINMTQMFIINYAKEVAVEGYHLCGVTKSKCTYVSWWLWSCS